MTIDSNGHSDQGFTSRSCSVRNAVPLRSDVRVAHVLPPGIGVAVHEYQPLITIYGCPSCPCQVCRFKARVAMQVSFATSRQKYIRNDGRFTLRTSAWRPQAEAEVFLLSPLPVVLEEVITSGFVSLGRKHGFVPN